MLGSLARNSSSNSLTRKMRLERFSLFRSLLNAYQNSPPSRGGTAVTPVQILDIGGTQKFWEWMAFTDVPDVFITLVNPVATEVDVRHRNFRGIVGDGTNLLHVADREYDVVFSNSVIEHVATFENQRKMAHEIRRVGRCYFVQTPNYYFPIEPHFLFPGFQWLPPFLRIWLLQTFPLYERRAGGKRLLRYQDARDKAEEIRLLKRNELLALFPTASLYEEKLWGMTKSFIVHNFSQGR